MSSSEKEKYAETLTITDEKYFSKTRIILYNLNVGRNHVKRMHVINSRRGFSMGTVLWGEILTMCLADLLGIADLDCEKVVTSKNEFSNSRI